MVLSHCEILWDDSYGEYLGRHLTENYASGLDDSEKQEIISQQRLRSKMLGLRINNYLATDANGKLRDFSSAYNYNTQDDGYAMLFAIVKMVRPETCAGCSDIKYNLENMKMYYLKHEISKANLQIAKCMNDISITGETYS